MLTRIEIDGFKSFHGFGLDLKPFTAIVGPNASGKSNLFDALRFLSRLAQHDIRTAMQDLRGQPEELFRQTAAGIETTMTFAVEVLLDHGGVDAFGSRYETPARRLRYELTLELERGEGGAPRGVFVRRETCEPIARDNDRAFRLVGADVVYNARFTPFIKMEGADAILVRQDGVRKRGRPVKLPLAEASRSALSTITTSEFPHLYALRDELSNIRFLEINPRAARSANDLFEERVLKADASNLAAVLARLKSETAEPDWPDGVLADIAAGLSSLIPSVSRLNVTEDTTHRQYAFSLDFAGGLGFSSRVISDGTLRLLALLTLLNDPARRGALCFEEPENGVHEGRIPQLVQFLRSSAQISSDPDLPSFQIVINTHSPAVMAALEDSEIVAADTVIDVDVSSRTRASRTRMRANVAAMEDMFNPDLDLTRREIEHLLRRKTDAA
jgi:predicted ATPase